MYPFVHNFCAVGSRMFEGVPKSSEVHLKDLNLVTCVMCLISLHIFSAATSRSDRLMVPCDAACWAAADGSFPFEAGTEIQGTIHISEGVGAISYQEVSKRMLMATNERAFLLIIDWLYWTSWWLWTYSHWIHWIHGNPQNGYIKSLVEYLRKSRVQVLCFIAGCMEALAPVNQKTCDGRRIF